MTEILITKRLIDLNRQGRNYTGGYSMASDHAILDYPVSITFDYTNGRIENQKSMYLRPAKSNINEFQFITVENDKRIRVEIDETKNGLIEKLYFKQTNKQEITNARKSIFKN